MGAKTDFCLATIHDLIRIQLFCAHFPPCTVCPTMPTTSYKIGWISINQFIFRRHVSLTIIFEFSSFLRFPQNLLARCILLDFLIKENNQRQETGLLAAGSTGLIQPGNILVSEMESLPKRYLLPKCLKY